MLDAIASAPFLAIAVQAPEPEDMDEHISESQAATSEPVASVPVFDAPFDAPREAGQSEAEPEPAPEPQPIAYAASRREPEPETVETVQKAPQTQDHEIAASAADAREVESAEERAIAAQKAEDIRRHSIHGTPEDPAPEPAAAPRKMGWWSRRKTG
jgi:hypothetical protein